jgi:hypothetical protein
MTNFNIGATDLGVCFSSREIETKPTQTKAVNLSTLDVFGQLGNLSTILKIFQVQECAKSLLKITKSGI